MERYGTEEEGIHSIARQNGFWRQKQKAPSCMTHKTKNRIPQLNSHSVWNRMIMCFCLYQDNTDAVSCLLLSWYPLSQILSAMVESTLFCGWPIFPFLSCLLTQCSQDPYLILIWNDKEKVLLPLLTFPEGSWWCSRGRSEAKIERPSPATDLAGSLGD